MVGVWCVIGGEDGLGVGVGVGVVGGVAAGGGRWSGGVAGLWKVNGPSRCALAGCGGRAVVSAWRRSLVSVGPDVVAVECRLRSGGLGCPDCGRGLAPWGWAAARFVRAVD